MRRVRVFSLLAGLACLGATAAQAAVIYETDFVTQFGNGNPFNAANLQFQDGWLGQNFTSVDPTGTGTANTPAATAFPRNLNNRGALGNQAGGAGGPGEIAGPGFTIGDMIRVTGEYQFTLAGRVNTPLATMGVRDNFSSPGAGFQAQPKIGAQAFYSEFESASGGALKLFGSLARNGFAGADNAFALIVSGLDIGLDPDGVAGPADVESDLLEISIELTYLGADMWQTSGLTLNNSTTATLLRDAAVDQPAILGEMHSVPSGNDLFMGLQWMRNSMPLSTFDSVKYEYFESAIPEPTSFALLSLAVAGLAARRRG